MKFNATTKFVMTLRRWERQAVQDGYEIVSENGSPLWKFHRGSWCGQKITDVKVSPNGIDIWFKHTGKSSAQEAIDLENWRARQYYGPFGFPYEQWKDQQQQQQGDWGQYGQGQGYERPQAWGG